jgi:hypothetical protein
MSFQLIHVGSDCLVSVTEVIAILRVNSAPIKRLLRAAEAEARLADATDGKVARAVVAVSPIPMPSVKTISLAIANPDNSLPMPRSDPSRAIASSPLQFILSPILPETVAERLVFRAYSSRSTVRSQFPGLESLSIPMDITLINIGFGNIIAAQRVIAIIGPDSAPIKRIISDARERGQLIDATYGRRTRAVIVTDSGHIVLTSIQPETVANRFAIARD